MSWIAFERTVFNLSSCLVGVRCRWSISFFPYSFNPAASSYRIQMARPMAFLDEQTQCQLASPSTAPHVAGSHHSTQDPRSGTADLAGNAVCTNEIRTAQCGNSFSCTFPKLGARPFHDPRSLAMTLVGYTLPPPLDGRGGLGWREATLTSAAFHPAAAARSRSERHCQGSCRPIREHTRWSINASPFPFCRCFDC